MSEDPPNGDQTIGEPYEDNQDDRISILTVAKTWWHWCLGLIFTMTIAWTALVAWSEITNEKQAGATETIVAIVSASASGEPLIIIYSLMIVTALDALGGFIMVTKRYLMNKWVKPQEERIRRQGLEKGIAEGREKGIAEGRNEGIEKGLAEGRNEGRNEERQAWIEWNNRRLEAEAQGRPFNEPLPSS